MVKMRFREKYVYDGEGIEIPKNAMCLSIHTDRAREELSAVTWLEEIPFKIIPEKEK